MKYVIGNGFIGKYLLKKGLILFPRIQIDEYDSNVDYGTKNEFIFTSGLSKPDEFNDDEYTEKMINGTISMLKDIAENNRVIYLSSDVVLGKTTKYSLYKQTIENAVKDIDNVFIVRLSYVFSEVHGYYDNFTKEVLDIEYPEIYIEFKRNIIHINDVFDGLMYIFWNYEKAPKVINLSGEHLISKKNLLEYINKKYVIIKPNESFWDNRDKEIEMKPNFYIPKITL